MKEEQIKQKAEEWMRNNSERCTKENMNGYDFAIATCIAVTTEATKELEKENAELKKNYEDSLVACGLLKEKIDLMTKPSPIEVMQDALITTQKVAFEKQKDQLTKAKEIIREFVDWANWQGNSKYPSFKSIQDKAEQFLKDFEK